MTTGLLLAGGKSSRFIYGDKALYKDFPERCFSTLSDLTDEVFVSAKSSNLAELQKRLTTENFLLDAEPYVNQGPLSALYALANERKTITNVLLLSVDNPEISVESLKKLLEFPNAYVENYFTIAHLTFEPSDLTDYLQSGQRRMKGFLDFLNAKAVEIPENELVDHNKK